jgi:hypothetical protein
MTPDPREILREIGLDPTEVNDIQILSQRHGHAIWRIATWKSSYVLKWLPEPDGTTEIEAYRLLQKLGVPTLPLYGIADQALLLEDLGRSEAWRLAVEADAARPEVGRAVAQWYRVLHDGGEALLARGSVPALLTRETDELDPDAILATGQAFGLADYRVWRLAAEHIEMIKAAIGKLSVTLNCNDFYWTNLALSKGDQAQLEATIFDYHLMGIGMRYSDWRNVTGSLYGEALLAFREAYGPTDPREEVPDRPTASLYGLIVAARMPAFPRWAESCLDRVIGGGLEQDLSEAIDLAQLLATAHERTSQA